MSVLSGALAAGGYLDRPTQDASVAVRRYRGDLRLQNAALGIDVTASFSSGAQSDACKYIPEDQTLASAGAIPITYVASLRTGSYGIERPPSHRWREPNEVNASIDGRLMDVSKATNACCLA